MKKRKKILILISILVFCLMSTFYFLGRTEKAPSKISLEIPEPSQEIIEKRKEYCLENFDLDKSLEDGSFASNLDKEILDQLTVYSACEAILSDELRICQDKIKDLVSLNPPSFDYISKCESLSLFWDKFLNKLIRDPSCKESYILSCASHIRGEDIEEKKEKCRRLCQAFLDKDLTVCLELFNLPIKEAQCRGYVSQSEKYCYRNDELPEDIRKEAQGQCLEIVRYFSIIKGGNRDECENLEYDDLRMLCKLYFNRNDTVCQQELERLKELFCQKYSEQR